MECEQKYLFWGEFKYLNAQLNAYMGLEKYFHFYSYHTFCDESKRIKWINPKSINGWDKICIGKQNAEIDYPYLIGKGISCDDICLIEDVIENLSNRKLIHPSSWRFVKENYKPSKIRLEMSTLCQLDCKLCYMRHGKDKVYGKGFLKFEDFKKLIDNNPFIKLIELSNNGEIFLNPDFEKILKYAYEKGVFMTAEGGVNFNDVTDSQLNAMIEYELLDLMIAMDGVTNEAYTQYRKKGNVDKVINNIRKLQLLKKQRNKEYPKIHWQYIIMESTENEINLAKELAEELQIDIIFKMTWDKKYVCKNKEAVMKLANISYTNREEYEKEEGMPYGPGHPMCIELFEMPRINYDGRLFGCCAQHYYDLGVNVFEVGIENALRTASIKYSKLMLCGIVDEPLSKQLTPCSSCNIWKEMKKYNWRFILKQN